MEIPWVSRSIFYFVFSAPCETYGTWDPKKEKGAPAPMGWDDGHLSDGILVVFFYWLVRGGGYTGRSTPVRSVVRSS